MESPAPAPPWEALVRGITFELPVTPAPAARSPPPPFLFGAPPPFAFPAVAGAARPPPPAKALVARLGGALLDVPTSALPQGGGVGGLGGEHTPFRPHCLAELPELAVETALDRRRAERRTDRPLPPHIASRKIAPLPAPRAPPPPGTPAPPPPRRRDAPPPSKVDLFLRQVVLPRASRAQRRARFRDLGGADAFDDLGNPVRPGALPDDWVCFFCILEQCFGLRPYARTARAAPEPPADPAAPRGAPARMPRAEREKEHVHGPYCKHHSGMGKGEKYRAGTPVPNGDPSRRDAFSAT